VGIFVEICSKPQSVPPQKDNKEKEISNSPALLRHTSLTFGLFPQLLTFFRNNFAIYDDTWMDEFACGQVINQMRVRSRTPNIKSAGSSHIYLSLTLPPSLSLSLSLCPPLSLSASLSPSLFLLSFSFLFLFLLHNSLLSLSFSLRTHMSTTYPVVF